MLRTLASPVEEERFASERRYPARCPACGAVAGYPVSVQTVRAKPGHIRIEIGCHACKEHWSEEVDTD